MSETVMNEEMNTDFALSVLEDYEMYQELKNTSAALFKK